MFLDKEVFFYTVQSEQTFNTQHSISQCSMNIQRPRIIELRSQSPPRSTKGTTHFSVTRGDRCACLMAVVTQCSIPRLEYLFVDGILRQKAIGITQGYETTSRNIRYSS